jgi:hypothetical protein
LDIVLVGSRECTDVALKIGIFFRIFVPDFGMNSMPVRSRSYKFSDSQFYDL